MLNSISLMGRLTRDPELKYTQNNIPVCTITLACERDFRDSNGVRDCDFIDVVAWRGTAELICRWFREGLLIAVEGRLQGRRWKDKFEQNRVTLEVIADSVYFAERADQPEGAAVAAPAQRPAGAPQHGPRSDLRPVNSRNADVFPEEDAGDYTGDLYRGGLPRSEFEGFDDDDGDVPF